MGKKHIRSDIGFAGDSSISFLAITVEATAARFGPRLGTGLSWIL